MDNRKCIVCDSRKFAQLMTLNNMPSAVQHMPDKADLGNDKPLRIDLCQCKKCGLVQFVIDPVYYYKDVIRAGGGTTTMKAIRHDEYRRLLKAMRDKGINGRKIVEVGCGKGEFLGMWFDLDDEDTSGLDLTGIEHSDELVRIGQGNGLNVIKGFAEGNNSYSDEKYDAFVQFNFLEHQPHPADMLRNIWMNLNDQALGLITVPSFEYIIENDGYYELMRDHIAYYTVETLSNVCENNGFHVLNSQIVNRDTIEFIVEKSEMLENEKYPTEVSVIDTSNLKDNYREIANVIKKHANELDAEGKNMAIWGASHQALTLVATTDLKNKVSYIIDSADFKQGRYSQASHLPIVSPDYFFENPVSEILIVAPGYTDEIAVIIYEKYGKDIRILVLKDKSIKDYLTDEAL